MRKKISELTIDLQNQNIVPLWAIANDGLIYSAALKQKHSWGKRSGRINKLMNLAVFPLAADFFIFCVATVKIILMCNKIITKKHATSKKNYKKVFICHGANAEKFIFSKYKAQHHNEILKINIITLEGLEEIDFISISTLIRLLVKNIFGLSNKIKKLTTYYGLNYTDFLTIASLNVAEYVFFRTIFQSKFFSNIEDVTFLALHVASYSAVEENIKIAYFSHGLIKLSILMPRADSIFVLTHEEKIYISRFLFNTKCSIIDNNNKILRNKKNSVIFLSPEMFDNLSGHEQENINTFFSWCNKKNIKVVLRPSPRISDHNLLKLKIKFPLYEIDSLNQDFSERMDIVMPIYVIGFNSTGMYTAIKKGIIPISFCDPSENNPVWNMIYPMQYHVLFWPRDNELIDKITYSMEAYSETLGNLSKENGSSLNSNNSFYKRHCEEIND